MASGWGNNTFGFLKWGQFGDETVNVTNPNDTLWGTDTYGSYFYGGGGNLNATLQDVVINTEINTGWGSDTWGTETWGQSGLLVDVTGIGLTATLDSVTTKSDVDDLTVTGDELTITQGATEGGTTVDVDVTGQPMTATLQYQEAVVDVTGEELTANDGSAELDANTIVEVSATSASTWNGAYAWGSGAYGNEQITTLAMAANEGEVDPAPDANITGIEMTATLDDVVTQGDANTGTITDIAWGEETWGQSTWGNGSYFDATGYAQAATINLGTAVLDANTIAEVSGQELTMQENSVDEVTGNANVLVSGNALTMAQGSLRTLIWNQVNTGTAPVVPPGWQEVDTAA